MINFDIKASIKENAEYTEKILERYLSNENIGDGVLADAMRYATLGGGKRIRAYLVMKTGEMFGATPETCAPFAAAIEMIHASSLVHDDLPAMDNDAYRRGRKTTHVVYGEGMAVLAGDGLLNYAFETAAAAFEVTKHPQRVARAFQVLAHKAGIYGMIGGQCADLEGEGTRFGRDKLDFIYNLKTGALLEASFMIGAILAGAEEPVVKLMEETAADVGLAFQIQDDILDVTGDEQLTGKPVNSDEKNQKVTYVTLEGLETASAEVRRISERAIDRLKKIPQDAQFLICLVESLVNRQK